MANHAMKATSPASFERLGFFKGILDLEFEDPPENVACKQIPRIHPQFMLTPSFMHSETIPSFNKPARIIPKSNLLEISNSDLNSHDLDGQRLVRSQTAGNVNIVRSCYEL